MTGARTLIMGVLNVTPDSFSDGGRYATAATAIGRGRALAAQGADIVDIGGESTRPGAAPVHVEEEQRRILPVVRALAADGIAVSVDTIHAETAAEAIASGARYINDVSGGTHDPGMLGVAARGSRDHGTRFIVGHWRGIPDPDHQRSDYDDVVVEVRDSLARQADAAIAAGVDPAHLVVDPGLGFDKTSEQGWRLLAGLDAIRSLGYPVLVGASRKRMLADALERVPSRATGSGSPAPGDDAHARDLATAVVSALAARAGVWGVRVHDVAGSAQALEIARLWAEARAADHMESADGTAGSGGSAIPSADSISRAGVEAGDRISLTGLEVFAHHGVFDFERERGQRFLIDAEVSVDLRRAAAGDELASTVHYGELAEALRDAILRDPVDLIETVAERLAGVALGFPGVRSTTITVHKPDAPIDATFSDVSVTVVRTNSGPGGAR